MEMLDGVLVLLGGLGGLEFIKFLFNRNASKRKEEASATSVEMVNLLKVLEIAHSENERLRAELLGRNQKIDHMYVEVRTLQAEINKLQAEIYARDITIQQLQMEKDRVEMRKCDIHGCERRKPPSEYMA